MHIVFGDSFDDGAWPGPLRSDADAALDEAWVGVDGLTRTLETRLGLLRLDPPSHAERAAALAQGLAAAPGDAPWAASLAVDPLATARALLRVRDALVDVGVDDSGADVVSTLPPRLAAIWAATRGALPGRADRTRAVAAALEAGEDARVDAVATVVDTDALPPLTRRLLAALARQGTLVAPQALPRPLAEHTDLSRARRPRRAHSDDGAVDSSDVDEGFGGDGSLLLLRPDDVASAADEVAAFIKGAVDDDGAEVVVIAGRDADDGLDDALFRRDAPTLGRRGGTGEDALLAVLPLTIAVAAEHPDPERLFELCALPLTPVPRTVGARLKSALMKTPSARSPTVHDAIEAGLLALLTRDQDAHGADGARERNNELRARLAMWMPACFGQGGAAHLDVDVLLARALHLLRWLQGRQKREYGDEERTPYRGAIRQVSLFRRLLTHLGQTTLTPPQLLRVLETATASTRPWPRHAATAGLTTLRAPGSLCGPAQIVVWWGFTQESARLPRAPFSSAEELALRAAGFAVPTPAARARAHARAERRPLEHARERLIWCCPRRGADGREQHPHPLWDELLASLPKDERRAATRALVRPQEDLPGLVVREAPAPRPLPQPRAQWRIPPASFAMGEVASPSTEERLLGCALRAVLHERRVRPAAAVRLPSGAQLEGQVVHVLFAHALRARPASGADAAALVRAAFDDVVAAHAGGWMRPEREQTRVRVRERAARAVAALVDVLVANGLEVVAVEEEVSRAFPDGRTLKGTPDLVVADPSGALGRFVIDHKTANDAKRRAQLAEGTAVQLLDYAVMVGAKGQPRPGIAFFQLRARRLITTDKRLQGAELVVADKLPKDAWADLDAARAAAFTDLAAGLVAAPAADGTPPHTHASATPLRLEPPCAHCAYDVLCGRAFAAGQRVAHKPAAERAPTNPGGG